MPVRLKKFLLFALVLGFLALATLPWWLGVALRPVAKFAGAEFGRYERRGYTRFQLHEVRFAREGFVVTVERAEADSPLVWAMRRLRGIEPVIDVAGWRLAGSPKAAPTGPSMVAGLADLQAVIARVLPRVLFWVPQARLVDGIVQGYGPEIRVATAGWNQTGLLFKGVALADHAFDGTVSFADDGVTLRVEVPAEDAHADFRLRGGELTGSLQWRNQTVRVEAAFPARGWQPQTATLVADSLNVPAELVRLAPAYVSAQGSVRAEWHDGNWRLDLEARATPNENTHPPPLSAQVAAHGDLHELTVDALHVDAPFALARLSAPVTISLTRPSPEQHARLEIESDLAKIPWIRAQGRATGTVEATALQQGARLGFALDFADVVFGEFSLPLARARGDLQWPQLTIESLAVEMSPSDRLALSGRLDLASRELAGVSVQAEVSPEPFARWLPAGLAWEKATVEATVDGPLTQPRHQGRLMVHGLSYAPLHPLDGEAQWRGQGRTLDEANVRIKAGESSLQFAGRVDDTGVDLRETRWEFADQPTWQLTKPARISWASPWRVGEFHLSGPDGHLQLQATGGTAAAFAIDAANFASTRLTDWITLPGPAWRIESLQGKGRAQEGRLLFDAKLAAGVSKDAIAANLRLAVRAEADGLHITELSVVDGTRALTRATGRLPVTWLIDPSLQWQVNENAPLELSAAVDADSPLWSVLGAYADIDMEQPNLELVLRGTLGRPDGRVQLRAEAIRNTGRPDLPLPEITGLRLDADLRRDALTVSALTARIDGQAAEGSGILPMDDARWRQLWRTPAQLDWTPASGKLTLADADLAVFARRLPEVLAPQGRLGAHLELAPGGRWQGALRLTGGATRPLPPFGTLQDINADLRLNDSTLTITSLNGRLGGEPVTVAGTLSRTNDGTWLPALTLRGSNLPLVRSPGLLVRTDLDLRTDPSADGNVRLGGSVTVRDCLVLASLASLLPSGARGAARTPPYFAVEAARFRDWPIEIELRGERAVRVRTAVFQGTSTPRFRLTGTLGEPRAVGQLTVDEGRVLFPFATFTIQQGAVRLSEADPFTPQISAHATTRRHGYDLTLEAGGTPAAPTLTFSANPALEAADVLMMITTGQPPETDAAGLNTQQRLARFGTFLGRGLIQEFGLGGDDRLEITTGEEVSRMGRETYRIEYRVNDRWFLTGEYDEYDHYNAGVRWRVHTAGGPADEASR